MLKRKGSDTVKKLDWLLLVFFSAVAAFLRFDDLRTGFDANGLPIGGAAGKVLPILLLLAAAAFFVLSRKYPAQRDLCGAMEEYFDFSSTASVMLSVLGAFVLIAVAVLNILSPLRSLLSVLLSVFWIAAGASVIYVLFMLRRGAELSGVVLLTPVCALVLQLISTYRTAAADPVLGHIYIDILVLAALTVAFLEFSAFAFRNGAPRLFLPLCEISVVLCACEIIAQRSPLTMLFHAGFALILLGYCAAAGFTEYKPKRLGSDE